MQTACPACNAPTDLDEYRGAREPQRKPSPGSVAVCWGCGEILRFTQELAMELYPLEDFERVVSASNKTLVRNLQTSIRERRKN